jgi:teichoic acid transport system ATP-binding protein
MVAAREASGSKLEARDPAVIVDSVRVNYHVYSTGKPLPEGQQGGRIVGKGNHITVEAVRGISFVAFQGDSIGVIGTNGSGKTSLMKAIAGLQQLAAGRVYASHRPNFLGVGAALLRDLSGERNIVLGGLALGFSRAEIRERMDAIIDFAGLRDFIELPMRTYSAGMTERLKFAIAASREHEILIIDEALAVGDSRFRKKSEARMRELASGAGVVFLVSHSLKSILNTCNRVIWIDEGELRMDGEPRTVCQAYADAVGAELDE